MLTFFTVLADFDGPHKREERLCDAVRERAQLIGNFLEKPALNLKVAEVF